MFQTFRKGLIFVSVLKGHAQACDHHSNRSSSHSRDVFFGVGQGYGAVKGRVGEVEVWGLGGASADEQQAKYQHRENMFSEQRRKVCGQYGDNKLTKPDCKDCCKIALFSRVSRSYCVAFTLSRASPSWQVDLKNFGNWKDSPEALMMDMVSNPNKPAREER